MSLDVMVQSEILQHITSQQTGPCLTSLSLSDVSSHGQHTGQDQEPQHGLFSSKSSPTEEKSLLLLLLLSPQTQCSHQPPVYDESLFPLLLWFYTSAPLHSTPSPPHTSDSPHLFPKTFAKVLLNTSKRFHDSGVGVSFGGLGERGGAVLGPVFSGLWL